MIDLEELLNKVNNNTADAVKEENEGGFTTDPRVLKLKIGNTYHFRLVPSFGDRGPELFKFYKEVGFTSRTTDKYIYCGRSLSDYDKSKTKEDMFNTTQWDEYKKAKDMGDQIAMKESYKLIPRRKGYLNVYLHAAEGDDTVGKEKIGEVVVIQIPATTKKNKETNVDEPTSHILKILTDALEGSKKAKIGKKAYDLSENGRSLIIKVTSKKGDNGTVYPDYSESNFDDAEDIGVDKEQAEVIFKSGHNLNEFLPAPKSQDEARKILDEHWFGANASQEDEVDPPEDEDEIPMGDSSSDLDDLLN